MLTKTTATLKSRKKEKEEEEGTGKSTKYMNMLNVTLARAEEASLKAIQDAAAAVREHQNKQSTDTWFRKMS